MKPSEWVYMDISAMARVYPVDSLVFHRGKKDGRWTKLVTYCGKTIHEPGTGEVLMYDLEPIRVDVAERVSRPCKVCFR